MIIWAVTIGINVLLALLLLFRGHWTKYKVLFASLAYEVFASPILFFIYRHYGTFSKEYAAAFHAKKLGTIAFAFGIIFEAWRWRNRCVRIPQEGYLLALLCVFIAKKAEFFLISDFIHDSLRWAYLLIACFWIYTFQPEVNHERRDFRPERTGPGRQQQEEAG